jgi:hypothetical protein
MRPATGSEESRREPTALMLAAAPPWALRT